MSKQPVVVITGASSGIGRATALRFASNGASVVLAARRAEALEELAEECERRGGQALAVPTDVSDADAVTRLADAAVARFGRIDVWLNSAAVSVYAPFAAVPLEDFRRTIDVNVMGPVYGSQAALRVMYAQRSGVIINISSIIGEVSVPYGTAYAMSKAAVRALSVSIRSELGLQKEKGIKVVTVMPATIDTPFFRHAANYTGRKLLALPPVYGPERVARKIVQVAHSPRNEVVVGPIAKGMVLQHRVSPVAVEGEVAFQVEKTHLSTHRDAEHTSGNLFTPPPSTDATVTGGWHGRERSLLRSILTWTLLIGGGSMLVRRMLRD